MIQYCRSIVLAITIFFSISTVSAQVRFNEVVTSNVEGLMAEHEFPDSWVELYCAWLPLVTQEYRIGQTDDFRLASPVYVGPQDKYKVVMCDKEHVPFRLDSDGGELYLFDTTGRLIDHMEYPAQIAPDVAYGLTGDGWRWMAAATPGESNSNAAEGLLPEPIFSLASRVMEPGAEPFQLTVRKPEGVKGQLCVAIGGRIPTEADAVEGESVTLEVTESMTVRAVLTCEGMVSPLPSVRSFIFLPEESELDVVNITVTPEWLYGEEVGLLATDLYKGNYRRPAYIEYFKTHDKPMFAQHTEFRFSGAVSRQSEQKSMVFYANKRFGEKRFKGQIWEQRPEVKKNKSLLLRNGGNCFYAERINDQLVAGLAINHGLELDCQAYTPALCFINGEYKGIYDVRERSNEDFVWAHYDGLEDIDMVENHRELKCGSAEGYEAMIDYGNSDDLTLEGISELMELETFLNQYAIRVIGHDTDWPQNNIVAWRPADGSAPFRWLMKDCDFIGHMLLRDNVEKDYFDHLDFAIKVASDPRYTRFFKRFTEVEELRELLTDRIMVMAGDVMRAEVAQRLGRAMKAEIQPNYMSHLQVYYGERAEQRYGIWDANVDDMLNNWWPKRVEAVYATLSKRFGLGEPVALTVSGEGLRMNGVKVATGDFRGKCFAGREVRLSAAEPSVWTLMTELADGTRAERTLYGAEVAFTLADNVKSTVVTYAPGDAAVEEIRGEEAVTEYYNLQGVRINPKGYRGVYVDNKGGRFRHGDLLY